MTRTSKNAMDESSDFQIKLREEFSKCRSMISSKLGERLSQLQAKHVAAIARLNSSLESKFEELLKAINGNQATKEISDPSTDSRLEMVAANPIDGEISKVYELSDSQRSGGCESEIEQYFVEEKTNSTPVEAIKETENGACEELAEMPHSRIEKQTQASRNEGSHSAIKEVSEVENLMNYEGEATTKRVLGDQGVSENGAYKVLDEMFHPNSLNIAETQGTNKDISRGEQHFEGVSPIDSLPRVLPSNRGARFDEYEENSGLFLFDPGGKSVKHLGEGIVQSFTSQTEHQGEVNFVLTKDGTVRQRNDEAVQSHLLKFSSLTKLTSREIYAQGIDSGYKQYQFYLVNPYSCSSKIMMQLAKRECENSTPFIGKEVIFSFDPGGSSCLLGAWNWNDLETFEMHHGRNLMEKSGIIAIKVDQYNEVGDLSYACVDILEFGGSCEDSFTIAAAQIGTENTVTGNFILSFKNISNDLNNHLKQVWPFLFFYKGFHVYMFTPLLLLIFCIWAFPMAVIVCKDLNISSIRPKELNENVDAVVIPVVQVNAIWGDESEFAVIFDLDHFKKVLANDVRILSLLPSTCLRALDHFHEARFLSGQNVVLIMDTTLENFVWHPGLCAIFLLILEVKDVFKRVGKRMIPMGIQLPRICRVTYSSSSCSWLIRLENEVKQSEKVTGVVGSVYHVLPQELLHDQEPWSSTLITHLAIKIDEGSGKNFEIKVGYGLAIEIKYFWCCVSNVFQIFLIGDDQVLVKLVVNGFSCCINRVGLAAHNTLKVDPYKTEVPAFMKSVCDLNNASCRAKGLSWGVFDEAIFSMCPRIILEVDVGDDKAFDSWLLTRNLHVGMVYDSFHYHEERFKKGHKLVALIEATILEHFVWDPGLIWISHFPTLRFRLSTSNMGRFFFLHQQAISRVCTTLRTRLLLRGGVCHELSR